MGRDARRGFGIRIRACGDGQGGVWGSQPTRWRCGGRVPWERYGDASLGAVVTRYPPPPQRRGRIWFPHLPLSDRRPKLDLYPDGGR